MKAKTREEWLAERRMGIGGSDAAAVMGLSKWATPLTVWMEKTGRSPGKEENEAMRIGTELEDYVARSYTRETGRKVTRYTHMIHDGCLLGNFDRLVVPEGAKVASHQREIRTDTLLECKTSSREWDDGVPLVYQMQVQHYMGLCPALQFADVAVLQLGRKHFEIYRVARDQATIDYVRAYLIEWWKRYVETGTPPPPTNEADCRMLWARSNPGKSVEATNETLGAMRGYLLAKKREAEAKQLKETFFNSICAAMGDAEVLADAEDGSPIATWKSPKDTRKTDWEAIARELGATDELIAKHTETKPGARRFLAKVDAVAFEAKFAERCAEMETADLEKEDKPTLVQKPDPSLTDRT